MTAGGGCSNEGVRADRGGKQARLPPEWYNWGGKWGNDRVADWVVVGRSPVGTEGAVERANIECPSDSLSHSRTVVTLSEWQIKWGRKRGQRWSLWSSIYTIKWSWNHRSFSVGSLRLPPFSPSTKQFRYHDWLFFAPAAAALLLAQRQKIGFSLQPNLPGRTISDWGWMSVEINRLHSTLISCQSRGQSKPLPTTPITRLSQLHRWIMAAHSPRGNNFERRVELKPLLLPNG